MDTLPVELKRQVFVDGDSLGNSQFIDLELRNLTTSDFNNLVNWSLEPPSVKELEEYLSHEVTTIGLVSREVDNNVENHIYFVTWCRNDEGEPGIAPRRMWYTPISIINVNIGKDILNFHLMTE